MNREERKLALYCLKANSDYHSEVCEECVNYPNCDHTIQDDVTEIIIKALEQEPCYDIKEIIEVMSCDADEETKCKMISNILTAKPHYFKEQEPCDDVISRQAVLDHIYGINGLEGLELSNVFEKHYADFIKSLPSVSTEKTGRWIEEDIHNCHTNFKCSECGYIHNFMHLYGKPTADYTYCPHCGARMEVEE